MKYGPGWIVLEGKYPRSRDALVSVISPRRSSSSISKHIEQLYVDRYASMIERLEYKKSPNNFPYRTQVGLYSGIMHCGQNPVLHAIYAEQIVLDGSQLTFSYKILLREEPRGTPIFESKRKSISVHV